MNQGLYNNIKMEYKNIEILSDNAPNQPSKFRTKNWAEIGDESKGIYSVNRQISFKTSMLRSRLCDYSDAYIFLKGNIVVNNAVGEGANENSTNKKVIFKNFASFIDCISKINNIQVDNTKDIDI